MRLWHTDLLKYLPDMQLRGQWRECIALLGNGWGRKHSTVNYVFNYPVSKLVQYSWIVAFELKCRGIKVNKELIKSALAKRGVDIYELEIKEYQKYPEHDDTYYRECIDNLKRKGKQLFDEHYRDLSLSTR